MRGSTMPAELMFKEARDEVMHVTGDKQTPWEASSLTGQNFYFANAAHETRLASTQPAPAAAAAAEPEPEPAGGPASATANRVGRKAAGVLVGFGKGMFDAT
jgi:hypothetical protein